MTQAELVFYNAIWCYFPQDWLILNLKTQKQKNPQPLIKLRCSEKLNATVSGQLLVDAASIFPKYLKKIHGLLSIFNLEIEE